MKKGDIQHFQTEDKKQNFVKWMDSKSVHVISNQCRSHARAITGTARVANFSARVAQAKDILE